MVKRMIAVVVTVSFLFLCCSGTVFAAFNVTVWFPNGSIGNNNTGVIDGIKVSSLDSKGLAFMQDYYAGNGNFIIVLFGSEFYFVKLPDGTTKNELSLNDGKFVFNCSVDSVRFDSYTGEPKRILDSHVSTSKTGFNFLGLIEYSYLTSLGFTIRDNTGIWKPLYDGKKLVINFDSDLAKPPPPVSSEPEPPPPVSSEPDPPPPVSSEPALPDPPTINEDYLGVSPTAVNGFFEYVRSGIGTSTNAGLIIFFFVIGIAVTVKLIRYFSGE